MSSTLFSSMSPFPAGAHLFLSSLLKDALALIESALSCPPPPLFNDEEMKRREVSLNLTGAESSDESSQLPLFKIKFKVFFSF